MADVISKLSEKTEAFSEQNSGWNVLQVNYMRMCWGAHRPLEAGTFIPTPKFLEQKFGRQLFSVFCPGWNESFSNRSEST